MKKYKKLSTISSKRKPEKYVNKKLKGFRLKTGRWHKQKLNIFQALY